MDLVTLAWIGTDRCEPGQKTIEEMAPLAGLLVFLALSAIFWKIYKTRQITAKNPNKKALRLTILIISLVFAIMSGVFVWAMMWISGACTG